MMLHWIPRINQAICIGCGDCIANCPTDTLGKHLDKATLLYPKQCLYCGHCEEICPVAAIQLPILIVNNHPIEGTNNEKRNQS